MSRNYCFIISVLITLTVVVPSVSSEKILFFFGGGSYSHKASVWPWASELADRGHEVTFLSSYEKKPTNHSKIRDFPSKTLHNLMSKAYNIDRFLERERGEEQNILHSYGKVSVEICDTTLLKSQNDPVLQELIHKGDFDLVIINIIFGECGFLFAHKFNAKVIVFDASVPLSWFPEIYGYQSESSWIPDIIDKYDNIPLSFIDRMKNFFWPLYWFKDRHTLMYPEFERIMKEAFGLKEVPLFQDLEKNISLLVINSHPAADFAYSLPPFVVLIGGLNAYLPEKKIPETFEKFMDGAGPEGVVLISFGSTINLEQVPSFYSSVFFKVIQKHKNVRFLLKWHGPLLKGFENLDNLLVSDWLPQREILRHPKLKAFITHGGLNSIQEATFYGVPLLAIPLFSDQDYNAYRIEAQEVGFRMEIRDLSFEKMDLALKKILEDAKYKKNMEVKSKIFRDRPQSPLQTIIFWTEFVLRNDDVSALKPMNSHLNWFQRRLIDVYLAYCFIIILPLLLIIFIFVKLLNLVCGKKAKSVTTKKKIS